MTAEDRQRVKDTLAAALALPVRERPAFIDAVTAGAPHVRREVSLLVSLSEDAGAFLEQPAIGMPPNADPLPGDLIGGRYQLEEPLGHGGSASVFKARDTLLGGKPVAVKILRHGVFDDAALRNEIAALARIDHPGIASVTDAGTLLSGRLYLVTRYIAGPTLAERLDESKLSPKQAGRLARRLAAALAAAHEAGVLHLDLRPENIIREHPSWRRFGGSASPSVPGSPIRSPRWVRRRTMRPSSRKAARRPRPTCTRSGCWCGKWWSRPSRTPGSG